MEKVIKGLCEIGKIAAAYKLNDRRYEEGTIDKIEHEFTADGIFEYQTTGKEPILKDAMVKEAKSRAADMAKSRATAAGYIRDARLTERAAKSLEKLCTEWNMNKTQVINKLLEEQEQRQLL